VLYVLVCGLLSLQSPKVSRAAPVLRLFEPTDIEFEEPGVVELDMQFGVVRGETAYRLSLPDFEFDLGLTSNLELDFDGEFAIGGPDSGAFTFDSVAPDNLWASIKLGLLDFADPEVDVAWTVAMQLGPRFPVAQSAQGVGGEGLALLGCRFHQTYAVLNVGGLVDPGGGGDSPRPSGIEVGVNFEYPLGGDWALTSAVGAVRYFSPDQDQLTTTAGIEWSPNDSLQLSVVGLYGWLPGGDQYGLLFGVSPKFRLW
jgi:hypothetical protein